MLPITIIVLLYTDVYTQIVTHNDALFSLSALFILGVASTSFAGIIYIKLVKRTSAVFAAATTYIIPVIAIAWGVIDNEVLFPLHFVGICLIIVGVLIINRFRG
jgi:drug/metabolite transporter (DMT)-like permease